MFEQVWKCWVTSVSCSSPEPEDYDRDDDPCFHDDPDTSIDFEDGMFYQGGLDDLRVAIAPDHPGVHPSSTVSGHKAPPQKKRPAPSQKAC